MYIDSLTITALVVFFYDRCVSGFFLLLWLVRQAMPFQYMWHAP